MTGSDRPLFTEDSGARDAEWVQKALTGDGEAFGRLVQVYERRAVATAYRLLGNSDDALEVVQEACLRAYRSLARLKDPTRFGAWFLRTVSNLSLNARRSRKSGSTVALDEQQGLEGAATHDGRPVHGSPAPDEGLEGRELAERIDLALDTLPEKQRLSLVLFTIEGWAQKDIAELLECSVENVKWNVFQARKRLREQLGDVVPD